jgi:hypothetical protein
LQPIVLGYPGSPVEKPIGQQADSSSSAASHPNPIPKAEEILLESSLAISTAEGASKTGTLD